MLINVNVHPPDPDSLLVTEKKSAFPRQQVQGAKLAAICTAQPGLWVSLGMCPKDLSMGPEIGRIEVCHGGEGRAGGLSIGCWHSP